MFNVLDEKNEIKAVQRVTRSPPTECPATTTATENMKENRPKKTNGRSSKLQWCWVPGLPLRRVSLPPVAVCFLCVRSLPTRDMASRSLALPRCRFFIFFFIFRSFLLIRAKVMLHFRFNRIVYRAASISCRLHASGTIAHAM